MRVTKHFNTPEQRDLVHAFYQAAGRRAPTNVARTGTYGLTYDFMIGISPRDRFHEVLEALEDLHSGDEMLPMDVDEYISNLHRTAGAAMHLTHTIRVLEKYAKHAQPVALSHGDCTLGNIVRTRDDSHIFIDPANTRGMPCVELDQSKLMQSLDGWEVLKYGMAPVALRPEEWPRLNPTPLHYALLATHYWRMIPYQVNDKRATNFARMRLQELEALCKHFV